MDRSEAVCSPVRSMSLLAVIAIENFDEDRSCLSLNGMYNSNMDTRNGSGARNQEQIMKTKSFHHSNMGSYAPRGYADNEGYITYHDSPRYAAASMSKLLEWENSRAKVGRAAAATEIAERALQDWRDGK